MPSWTDCVGKASGRGINGIVYEGEWKNGQLSGQGKMSFFEGFNKFYLSYEGTYKKCALIKGTYTNVCANCDVHSASKTGRVGV